MSFLHELYKRFIFQNHAVCVNFEDILYFPNTSPHVLDRDFTLFTDMNRVFL